MNHVLQQKLMIKKEHVSVLKYDCYCTTLHYNRTDKNINHSFSRIGYVLDSGKVQSIRKHSEVAFLRRFSLRIKNLNDLILA